MTASSLVLSERLEAFRRSDEERDTLFQDLVHELEEVRHKLNLLQDDYGNETDSRRRLQQTIRALEVDLSEQKRAVESNNLIYAIIDGDGAVFKDELLARGKDGGAEAANELLAEIRKHLHTLHPDATIEDWGIIVQVYLNLEGMSRKLMACNLVKNTKEVLDFARGFTNAQPLFSFVDVGPGKELADHKMREMLRAVVRNRQVRHVVLGPCHDNGYLPVLRPYNSEPATSQKITLLDTTPAQPGFADLAAFKRLTLPGVFRSEPLPDHQAPRPVVTNGAAAASPSPSPATTVNGASAASAPDNWPALTPTTSWASMTKSHDGNALGGGGGVIDVGAKKVKPQRYCLLNKYDERLDDPIRSFRVEPEVEIRYNKKVKDVRPCNSFHLAGKCTNDYCQYEHERLSFTPDELLILRAKARNGRCTANGHCRDIDCPYSHHCRYARNCNLDDKCRFKETHYMELTPAKRVYQDGREEYLPA